MDIRRWYTLARPQYKNSCGISSLVSCWNYLHSYLGAGTKKPISTEEALKVIGIEPPYQDIGFGSFTGNGTLKDWFKLLNLHYGVRGSSKTLFKLHGKGRVSTTKEEALDLLHEGLRSENKAYIYHSYNHYFCPVGYESTAVSQVDAFKTKEQIGDNTVEWIIIGEISRRSPVFHVRKWDDIATDIDQ